MASFETRGRSVTRRYFEDFSPGSVFEGGPRRVTRDEIMEFAASFDPQPMHLDQAAAQASILGTLAASGWHSCCLLIRMLHDGFIGKSSVLGAPGIGEVRWLKPLRADETVTARATVLETRASRSRPEMGFVKFLFELFDSTGALLMILIVSPMFARRRAVQRDERPADDLDRQPDVRAPRRRDRGGQGSGRGASRAMKFFEDIRVGEAAQIGCHAFTAEEIKAFAARFDPQPFHLDEAAGARSMFGRLCASGWHTACVWMGVLVRYRQHEDAERRARGEPVALFGASPGFRDLHWPKPVYPGDIISYTSEIIDARASISRPEWGVMMSRNTGINQHGEPVLSFVSSVFVERRQKRSP